MVTVYDVPANSLIEKIAEYLLENVEEVKPPSWARFVKTGSHRQRPPDRDDWWYIRCASLLRKLYVKGPIGLSRLRRMYGGRKTGKIRPEHPRKAGGAIIRKALQQLEKAGLVKAISGKGRVLTDEGKSLLDRLAFEVKSKMG
ncbi:MAG: 30S ribosomal protein S19e [Candidatus Bathyarchaeota archaeon]